jgi:hypothetical protein
VCLCVRREREKVAERIPIQPDPSFALPSRHCCIVEAKGEKFLLLLLYMREERTKGGIKEKRKFLSSHCAPVEVNG